MVCMCFVGIIAMDILNSFVNDVWNRLIKEASRLARGTVRSLTRILAHVELGNLFNELISFSDQNYTFLPETPS